MGKATNLGLSRLKETAKRRQRSLIAFRSPFFALAVFVCCWRPALAALPCGPQPEILAADGLADIKHEAESKAVLIRQAPASVNVRNLVSVTRQEMRQKYLKIDKMVVDHYLLWVTCETISNDPDLAASQKFNEYSTLYRYMSEPIAIHQAGAPNE